jgi:hypothetical protein
VGRQLGWLGPLNRSVGLLVGRTHLPGMAVSLVGGDLGVPMSHNSLTRVKSPRKVEQLVHSGSAVTIGADFRESI